MCSIRKRVTQVMYIWTRTTLLSMVRPLPKLKTHKIPVSLGFITGYGTPPQTCLNLAQKLNLKVKLFKN